MKKNIVFSCLGLIIAFILGGCASSTNNTKTDVIDIKTNLMSMKDKSDVRDVIIKMDSEEYNATIKVQGRSSLSYPKKNFNIKLSDGTKYTLKANYIDKTHSRNIVTARIAAKLNKEYNLFTDTLNYGLTDGEPVEVYENGEYFGLYTRNIAKSKKMWGDNFVISAKHWTKPVALQQEINNFKNSGWEVEEGVQTKENIILFNELVKFINDTSDEEFINDFEKHLNKDATINYYLMLHLINGIDNTNKNLTLILKNDIWYPILYDMDSTWGLYHDGSVTKYDFNPDEETDEDSTHSQMVNKLWKRLKDNFNEEMSKRWFALRENILSYDSIKAEFDNFKKSVGEKRYKRDEERWYMLGADFEQIDEYLKFKLPYLDDYFSSK